MPGCRLVSRTCWRCEREDVGLIRDPLMPPQDPIGVCRDCARQRFVLGQLYAAAGEYWQVREIPGDQALAQ